GAVNEVNGLAGDRGSGHADSAAIARVFVGERPAHRPALSPYTTLFRAAVRRGQGDGDPWSGRVDLEPPGDDPRVAVPSHVAHLARSDLDPRPFRRAVPREATRGPSGGNTGGGDARGGISGSEPGALGAP